MWQCPASCGLSDVAYLTSSRHLRVDPDAWLTPTPSEAVSTPCGSRWVCRSRSGDLLPRSSAGRTYSPVPSASREPPICRVASGRGASSCFLFPGLVGQEMALSDYLKFIRQEALAAPRRSSARRGRQSPTAFSLGRRSLSAFFPSSSARFLRRLLCIRAPCGKAVVSRLRKGPGESGAICCAGSPCVCSHMHAPHTLLFSLQSQLFPVHSQPFR